MAVSAHPARPSILAPLHSNPSEIGFKPETYGAKEAAATKKAEKKGYLDWLCIGVMMLPLAINFSSDYTSSFCAVPTDSTCIAFCTSLKLGHLLAAASEDEQRRQMRSKRWAVQVSHSFRLLLFGLFLPKNVKQMNRTVVLPHPRISKCVGRNKERNVSGVPRRGYADQRVSPELLGKG